MIHRTPSPATFQVPQAYRLPAVARLLGLAPGADLTQARRFIHDAPAQGIDLDLLWARGIPPDSTTPGGTAGDRNAGKGAARFDQAAIVVPGAGRVGMVFASPPHSKSRPDTVEDQHLAEVIDAHAGERGPPRGEALALVQALAETNQAWLSRALVAARFVSVGRLLYLRRLNDPPAGTRPTLEGPWPGGVRVVTAADLGSEETCTRVLCACLDRSYEGTLDCPELFGLRETRDILASHRASGVYDPHLWWVAMRDEMPVACALFNTYPDQGSIELVYLGLAPEVRGIGLGRRLMEFGLHTLARMNMQRVACAVDERNAPARRLYDRLGFSRFDTRGAFVRPPIPRQGAG